MGNERIFDISLTRRDFLRNSGKAALAASAGLESIVACTPTLKETRQQLEDQKWDCNPIIPIPSEGCYTGGYRSFGHFGYGNQPKAIAFGKETGKTPAFWDISNGFTRGLKVGAFNDKFPWADCDVMINIGVVPEVTYRFIPFKSFKDIADGKMDKVVEKFAQGAREYEKPYVLIPFKEMNIAQKDYWDYAGEPAAAFVRAWRQMHRIFKETGANQNTVWAINFMGSYLYPYARPIEGFYPGDDVVDWIGFTIVNRQHEPYSDLRNLLRADYNWARSKHRTKPIALFEMVQSNNSRQHQWIQQAYKDLKERFPAVKMAQWWETILELGSMKDDQRFSENPASVEAMRQALRDPYFIGGPLPFLEKYKK
jgi:hypothetical protein